MTSWVHGSSSLSPRLSGLPTTEAAGRDGGRWQGPSHSACCMLDQGLCTGVMGRVTMESSPLGLPAYGVA